MRTALFVLLPLFSLLSIQSCVNTKLSIAAYKEVDAIEKVNRIFVLAITSAKDDDIRDFQSKLTFLLNKKLIESGKRSDFSITDNRNSGILKVKEFKSENYFEISSTSEEAQVFLNERKRGVGVMAREGGIYEILYRSEATGEILWRCKLNVASLSSAAGGADKAFAALWEQIQKDNVL
jgi:hypothetical protein